MEYFLWGILVLLIVVCIVIPCINHRRNMKLLRLVSSPERGTRAERRLVVKLLKLGVHPRAIFHDLYVQKKNGEFSQIDVVVAMPEGLLVIEVKDYSGWIFGNEWQKYWTQILDYGKEKYRFYNPIIQNNGHIRALQEQSAQLYHIPVFNIVLFAGDCTLKNVQYASVNTYVGYDVNIRSVLKKVRELEPAEYIDKKEIAHLLHTAVANGNDYEIVTQHLASVRRMSKNTPQPIVKQRWNLWQFWRR